MIFKVIFQNILYLASMLILVRAVLSMFTASGYGNGTIMRILEEITDPILAPFEVFTMGLAKRTGIDLSPLFAIIVLNMISNFVAGL